MKITVNITLNPEGEEESKNPNAYQNFNYVMGGFKPGIKLDEIQDTVYEWTKKQPKKK